VSLKAVSYDDPTAAALRDRLTTELEERYRKAGGGREHARPRRRPTSDQFEPPDGVFLLAHADGGSVGCGGLRRWGPGIGEIKRMYVDPAARGRGVGRAILEGLESAGKGRGYHSIRLETGTPQPEAIRLYEAAGYVRIDPYRREWAGELSLALQKHLGPERPTADLTLLDARFDDPEAAELRQRLDQDHDERYGPHEDPEMGSGDHRPPTADDFHAPGGLFVVARLDGRSVGCGGVRSLEGTIAEIKRMYVDPAARRRGIGRRILARLEDAAREAGYRTARLETGLARPEAIALYDAAGYQRIPPFGEYRDDPLSVCFEKRLA
jgi:GNAT superfamily N-acetyltransferase